MRLCQSSLVNCCLLKPNVGTTIQALPTTTRLTTAFFPKGNDNGTQNPGDADATDGLIAGGVRQTMPGS